MHKLLLLVCLAVSFSSFTQRVSDSDILIALKTGNASTLSSYFDSFIDLKLPERDELKNVGKTQASITIKKFFEDYNINSFELTSQRPSTGTASIGYINGKLIGDRDKYNLTLMVKQKGDKLAIITVRIN